MMYQCSFTFNVFMVYARAPHNRSGRGRGGCRIRENAITGQRVRMSFAGGLAGADCRRWWPTACV